MKQEGRILLVDDEEDILLAGKLLLKRHFNEVSICNRPEHIPKLLAEQKFDAILLDMNFSAGIKTGNEGIFWMNKILEQDSLATGGGSDTIVDTEDDFIDEAFVNWFQEGFVAP